MRLRRGICGKGFELSILSAIALSIAGYGGRFHPYLELACHFKLQYCVVGCAGLIFFSYGHQLKQHQLKHHQLKHHQLKHHQLKQQKVWATLSLSCIVLNL